MMATSKNKPINLALYVSILELAESQRLAKLDDLEAGSSERRAAFELIESGFLSDARVTAGGLPFFVDRIRLTPEGAVALVDWTDHLHRRSWRGRLGAAAIQVMLVLAGALANALTGFIG